MADNFTSMASVRAALSALLAETEEEIRSKAAIRTRSGIHFSLTEPKPEMVNVEDIAYALSNIYRWNGHCPRRISVAQHSIFVSMLAGGKCEEPPLQHEAEMFGLLHDAAEAYVGDLTSPLKAMIPAFETIELNIRHTVFDALEVQEYWKYTNMVYVAWADKESWLFEREFLWQDGTLATDRGWVKERAQAIGEMLLLMTTWDLPYTRGMFVSTYNRLRRILKSRKQP